MQWAAVTEVVLRMDLDPGGATRLGVCVEHGSIVLRLQPDPGLGGEGAGISGSRRLIGRLVHPQTLEQISALRNRLGIALLGGERSAHLHAAALGNIFPGITLIVDG